MHLPRVAPFFLLAALALATITFAPVIALCAGILIVNAIIEYHKRFTQAAPVDLEVITVGVAYVSAAHGLPGALLLALAGPVLAHSLLDYFGDATVVKIVSLAVVALVAAALEPTPVKLLAAVMAGLVVQFVGFVSVLGRSAATNALARLTTLLLSAYLLFFLVPLVA
jgi:hypothetical protein